MKNNRNGNSQNRLFVGLSVFLAVNVNVILSYFSYRFGLPVTMDMIGTIGISIAGGMFPGILTAVVTSVTCMAYDDTAVYYGFINAVVAIWTAYFARKKSFQKIKDVVLFVLAAGAFCGGIRALIQWSVLGEPRNSFVRSMISVMDGNEGAKGFFAFFFIMIFSDICDKIISVVCILLILRVIPSRSLKRIKNGGWGQRILSEDEIKVMDSLGKKLKFSLKKRMTITLMAMAVLLVVLMGIEGLALYFNRAMEERKENAKNAAAFAASVVDADRISDYIRRGESAKGYWETKNLLYQIRENATGVRYLYLVKIEKEGSVFIFDLDEKEGKEGYAFADDVKGYHAGELVPTEEVLEPYMDALLNGEEIPIVEKKTAKEWVATAYCPVYDSKGRFVCYAGADVSIDYLLDYMKDFAIHVFIIMAGFFVLILAYGLWITDTHMTYPVRSIVVAVKEFIEAGDDQKKLDAIVRKMRKIDIHTDDEMEMLYAVICDMAASQTEQMRGLRRFSENTAKMQDGLILTMADMVENRDSDTGEHVQKTAAYVRIIAEGLKKRGYYAEKVSSKFISDVTRSAPLHDIGKINIPDYILNKPGKLTDEEFEIMKTHTIMGRQIMEKAIHTIEGENYLKETRNMVAYHHERWDGKGYPEGLHGEVIPLSARIMAVADAFDALSSPRVYKEAFSFEKAAEIIREGSGSQFDPKCVEVFLEALPEIKVVYKKYSRNL